jgi:hypothetical protein
MNVVVSFVSIFVECQAVFIEFVDFLGCRMVPGGFSYPGAAESALHCLFAARGSILFRRPRGCGNHGSSM